MVSVQQPTPSVHKEREWVTKCIEGLRIPTAEAHKLEWEKRERSVEVQDLSTQLVHLQRMLAAEQDRMAELLREGELLQEQEPVLAGDLATLRGALGVRVEGVYYTEGSLPEKAATVCKSLPQASDGSSRSITGFPIAADADGRAPPGWLEFHPHDFRSEVQGDLEALDARLATEQERRHAFAAELRTILRNQETEHELIKVVFQQHQRQTEEYRRQVHAKADEATAAYLQLQAQMDMQEKQHQQHKLQLEGNGQLLAEELERKSIQLRTDAEAALASGQAMMLKATNAHAAGIRRNHSLASGLQLELAEVDTMVSQRVQVLKHQLHSLRKRYHAVSGQRNNCQDALRGRIEGLQHATRQCESMTMRCVDTFLPKQPSKDREQPAHGSRATKVEALALRPALRKLRRILDLCRKELADVQRASRKAADDEGPMVVAATNT
eukprot:CAMPEP_0178430548 /NCGR_PEP_ID=MMETSP0689_2-20121128/31377_1 /TAXON_ID=160604 /ORGANISM="Amphidinium massartii, Strain CS-259" /LENGTH=439 /DNA_ID=CAMNT_0020052409 /DNA_START=147 /DNA_END=1462 /DNA_ORIENTATION=-